MAMVDVLCDMKERALKEVNPHLMTIATLTGHAVLANGPYTNVMDNGPAKREAFAQGLQVMALTKASEDIAASKRSQRSLLSSASFIAP